jgi:glycosyltransferase involved in cell wall biosynthesis
MRIMFLHRNLAFGGAEMLIVEVAVGLKKRGHDVMVVTFYEENPLGVRLTEADVALECLRKYGRWDVVGFVRRFRNVVRRFQPCVLYTLMPVPNLVALTGRRAKPNLKLIWGVSIANLDLGAYDFVSRMSYWLETRLSRFADLVISNSRAGFDHAICRGFPKAIMRTVPVPVDPVRYYPDPVARNRIRSEWGITDGDRLIGLIGRLDPQKDITTFLAAAANVASSCDHLRFVVVGSGQAEYRASLLARCEQLGISALTLWIPARRDIEAIYNALDLMVLSSAAEGSSVAVVQAMACGTSVVATEVGDSALEVGSWGQLAPPRNPAALADAIRRQLTRLAKEGDAIADGCRKHILEHFSTDMVVSNTEALMLSLCAPTR